MKKNIKLCLLALASVALITSSVRAATVSAADGDLILGFGATTGTTGGDKNLTLDLGSIKSFYDATPGTEIDLSLRLSATDLAGIYGSDWFSRADLKWGAEACYSTSITVDGKVQNTIWFTDPVGGSTPVRKTDSLQNTPAAKILNLDNGINGKGSTPNSDYAVNVSTGDANSWKNQKTTTYFNLEGAVSTVKVLDLYEFVPTTSGTAPGKLIGKLTLNDGVGSNPTLTFQAIPEPSTWMLVGCGLGMMAMVNRFRKPRRA